MFTVSLWTSEHVRGGKSPRHAELKDHLSGGWRKILSTIHVPPDLHVMITSSSVCTLFISSIHCTDFIVLQCHLAISAEKWRKSIIYYYCYSLLLLPTVTLSPFLFKSWIKTDAIKNKLLSSYVSSLFHKWCLKCLYNAAIELWWYI